MSAKNQKRKGDQRSAHSDADLVNTRSRFFPFWWRSIGLDEAPLYHVIVASDADLELAKSAQPEEVRAEYDVLDLARS
jgi:hypothetical protein